MRPVFSQPQLDALRTPAFVYAPRIMAHEADVARSAITRDEATTHLFLAMKSFTIRDGLERLVPKLDGLHASSLFEAKLARDLLGSEGKIHLTSPCLRADEIDEIGELCDHLSFNSLTQWQRFRERLPSTVSAGLRVNPRLSLLDDERYDPSRRHSKLGAPIDDVERLLGSRPSELDGVRGVLVHTNCDATDFKPLLHTVTEVSDTLGDWLSTLDWINLGGGYMFDGARHPEALQEAIDLLTTRHGVELFFEPGASLVREACVLVTRVVDVFTSERKQVAVLDTSVNHIPEIFEYQYEHRVRAAGKKKEHLYTLAGATCLAGDVFGDYAFDSPLEVGSFVVFDDVGSYSMVKASMFNGVNLPTIYRLDEELTEVKRFGMSEFLSRCGV